MDVRNICAHYARLYNQPIEDHPILPPAYADLGSEYVFPTILALKTVAGGHRVYGDMIRGIARLAEDFPQADLALCGFPADWEDVLKNA